MAVEIGKGIDGTGNSFFGPGPGFFNAEKSGICCLAAAGVRTSRFAELFGSCGDIEQVIDDLKSQADVVTIGDKLFCLFGIRAGTNRSGMDGAGDKSSRLVLMDGLQGCKGKLGVFCWRCPGPARRPYPADLPPGR